MFYIVETPEQLERLRPQDSHSNCYVQLIVANDNYHLKISKLVAVYIRPIENDILSPLGEVVEKAKGYIIPIEHDEGLNVDRDVVQDILNRFEVVWVLNKKNFLYQFNLSTKVYDISLKYSMESYKKLEISIKNPTYSWFYNRYGDKNNINQIIPLSILYQRCESTYAQVSDMIQDEYSIPPGYEFYNEYATKAYYLVEQSGLRVDLHNFTEKFKPTNIDFSTKGEMVYTSYNLYNVTSRPTNSFNSVNFLAIPKEENARKCFKPVGDEFVQFDFDGYHIRLVSELVKYTLDPNIKAHKQLAKLYGVNTDSQEEYIKAKASNFQMIYGSPSEQCKKLEFSQKIQTYIEKLWKEFNTEGYVWNPMSKKEFSNKLEDMYPQKLFNYLIQSLETSRNILVLCKVLGFLARGHYKSKVVLITYDSFLIDYDKSDGENMLDLIKDIMMGKTEHMIFETPLYPVSIDKSKDFNF